MILVTGGAGFVGSRVATRLVQQGETPRVLVRDAAKARQHLPTSGVEFVIGDTTQPDTLRAAVTGVDTIIHCAFITADRKQGPGVNYAATNVTGTNNLIAAAKDAGVQRIVEMGGLGTRPSTPGSYMQGRYEADEALKHSGLAWSILGPSIQFGHGSAFFNGLAGLIKSVPLVVPVVGSGKLQFQPIWVEDTVTCILKM
ncbi:MAG: NAD(P)H-binding protein, partial [Ktedonobacterales bacterium]